MSNLFSLSDAQMAPLTSSFPKSHGEPRVDDRRMHSGNIFVNRNGLRWRDASAKYGPHKTPYSRWKRWIDKGIFARMLLELVDQGDETDTLMIDANHLKTHCTASSLRLKKAGRCRLIGCTNGRKAKTERGGQTEDEWPLRAVSSAGLVRLLRIAPVQAGRSNGHNGLLDEAARAAMALVAGVAP